MALVMTPRGQNIKFMFFRSDSTQELPDYNYTSESIVPELGKISVPDQLVALLAADPLSTIQDENTLNDTFLSYNPKTDVYALADGKYVL